MLIRRLWLQLMPRRKKQLVLLFVLILCASFAEMVSIGAVLPFLSALLSPEVVLKDASLKYLFSVLEISNDVNLKFLLTSIFIAAVIISGFLRLILLWFQTYLSHVIGADFSMEIYRKTLYQPYSIHISRNSSEIIAGISSKVNTVINGVVLPLLIMVGSTMLLLAIIASFLVISTYYTLIIFGFIASIYFGISLFVKRRISVYGEKINIESNRVIKALQEGLGGIREVLIDGTQAAYCKIYRLADIPLRMSQAKIQVIGGAPRFVIETFGMIFIAIIAYRMMSQNTEGVEVISILGALAIGAQRLLPIMQQYYYSWTALNGCLWTLKDIVELLEQKIPDYNLNDEIEPIPFKDKIRLEEIDFKYIENASWVLKSINLEIAKGSRVGFMGETGSGKSTLLDLIMGLLEPVNGAIYIDGAKVCVQNKRLWQAHIAHVPQAIFLTDASIAENIAFGVPFEEIDHERVKIAAAQAKIDDFIDSLERKYNTIIGEKGVRLSGGQRQRIGIARALFKQADVIVFDEATSALDNQTENSVMNAIESISNEVTILIVAHRLTTLKLCDRVIKIEKGCVVGDGTYAEIVDDQEVFK